MYSVLSVTQWTIPAFSFNRSGNARERERERRRSKRRHTEKAKIAKFKMLLPYNAFELFGCLGESDGRKNSALNWLREAHYHEKQSVFIMFDATCRATNSFIPPVRVVVSKAVTLFSFRRVKWTRTHFASLPRFRALMVWKWFGKRNSVRLKPRTSEKNQIASDCECNVCLHGTYKNVRMEKVASWNNASPQNISTFLYTHWKFILCSHHRASSLCHTLRCVPHSPSVNKCFKSIATKLLFSIQSKSEHARPKQIYTHMPVPANHCASHKRWIAFIFGECHVCGNGYMKFSPNNIS